MEEWVKIEGYENYSVNIKGEVRNDKKERLLKSCLNSEGYYIVSLSKNGKAKFYLIHRLVGKYFIQNPNNYLCIDHKNGNRTDNSIENLRWCNHSQNNRNMKKRENTTSQFKGVSFHKRDNKWLAQCHLNGKQKYIGLYDTEIEAAEAYNNFVRENNLDDFNIFNVL
jgi:hypothetical protein